MSVFVFKWYYSRISVLSLVPICGESGRMTLVNLVQRRRRLLFLYHSVCFYEFSRPYLSLVCIVDGSCQLCWEAICEQ